MSASHHGDDHETQRILLEMFARQAEGSAKREFPDGRIEAEDDGALVYMIANDVQHQVIRIQFPKPTKWIALDVKSAEELRDRLTEGLFALRGIT